MAIQSFACRDTQQLFETGGNRRFRNIAAVAMRKPDYLDAAAAFEWPSPPPAGQQAGGSETRPGRAE
jgi:proteic killer suppression protein